MMNVIIDNKSYKELSNKFENAQKNISELINLIFDMCEINQKIKKASDFVLTNFINDNGIPLFSFLFNKGFTKGKTMCVICTHKYSDTEWSREASFPHYRNGDIWERGEFANKKRAKLLYSTFIEDITLWTNKEKI